jgi:hypothetical protein
MVHRFRMCTTERTRKPRPFQKPGRVGHPEMPSQSLGDDVPEWYYPCACHRQEKQKGEEWPTRPGNPQSWNRYAYALNNPLALTDPTGMDEGGGCLICWLFPPFGILEQIFGGPPSPPNAPPAPPGGYGAGIDAYGTWDEQVPTGVQALPSTFPGSGTGGLPGIANAGFGDEIPGAIGTAGTTCLFVPVCGEVEGTVIVGGAIILATGAIIHEGVKDGIIKIPQIYQSQGNRPMDVANDAWREIQRICRSRGVILGRDQRRQWHDKNVTGRNLGGFGELVQAGVEAFCPATANWKK